MPERFQRRTYKWVLGFFFGFFLFQGVFVFSSSVQALELSGDAKQDASNATAAPVANQANGASQNQVPAGNNGSSGGCFSMGGFSFEKCLLIPALDAVRNAMGLFAGAAAGMFVWVVDPNNISGPTGILNKGAVYDTWRFIRDFFNLFFILILLFSAFATIFQVESFSIRKIFLNILLAALIINFSFPITRFLIDLTNVPMYYFLDAILPGVQGGKAFIDSILANSGMGGLAIQTSGEAASANIFQAFSGAIFMFLFAISLIVLAVLMLIRIVALTLLLIFSPIGFAASLLPGMQSTGQKWWDKFWTYAFFGPSMALMLLVAIRFQNEIGKDGTFSSMVGVATNMSPGAPESSLLARFVFYAIPLILIWTAIGMAQSSSIAGAGKVVSTTFGMTKKIGRWTGGKLGGNFARNTYTSWNKSREAARADKKDRMLSTRLGKWASGRQDKLTAAEGLTSGQRSDAQARMDSEGAKKVKEVADSVHMAEMSVSELKHIVENGDKYHKAAAAQELAKKGALDMTDLKNQELVKSIRTTFGETSTVFRQMNNKIRQYDPVAAFDNIASLSPTQKQERLREYVNTNEFDAKKVNARSFGNENFVRTVIEEGAVSMRDLEDAAKKSNDHRTNIKDQLRNIATAPNAGTDANGVPIAWNQTEKKHKAMQEAHFNFNGSNSNVVSTNPVWQQEIYGKLNKEFGSNVTWASTGQAGHMRDIVESVNPSNYAEWIQGIKDRNSARQINAYVLTMGTNGNPNAEALKRIANDHPFLKNFR